MPGKPRVESDRYEVPIYLNGAGNDVAALDFSLAYDPAVFQPVGISPGAAASAAGKLVTANLPEPGKYIVVMMGFNQTPVANGEVARIVLERVGTAPQGETRLTVKDPTLSTREGVELPAEGGDAAVAVTPRDEVKPADGNSAKPDAAKPEKPGTSAEGEVPGTKPQSRARAAADGANENTVTAPQPKVVAAVSSAEKTAVASGAEEVGSVKPSVAEAAARAVEARDRLGDIPTGNQSGHETKTSSVAMKQDGQRARSTDIQPSGSFKVEASDTVNNNTADSTQPGGTQRVSVAAGGWRRLGLAAAVLLLLTVAGGAWLLRLRIFR